MTQRNPSCLPPQCLTTPNTNSSRWCSNCPWPCQIPLPLLPVPIIRNVDVFPSPNMSTLPISWGRSICFRWFKRKVCNCHAQENRAIVWLHWLHIPLTCLSFPTHPKPLLILRDNLICFPICPQLDNLKKLHWIRNKISIYNQSVSANVLPFSICFLLKAHSIMQLIKYNTKVFMSTLFFA